MSCLPSSTSVEKAALGIAPFDIAMLSTSADLETRVQLYPVTPHLTTPSQHRINLGHRPARKLMPSRGLKSVQCANQLAHSAGIDRLTATIPAH